jgi:pectate lyase
MMKRLCFFAAMVLFLIFSNNVLAIPADGWASVSDDAGTPYNLTGGAGGPTVTVYDEPNLLKYATSVTPGPLIVQVSGTINIPLTEVTGRLEISANKTIRGIGTNPTLVGLVDFKNRDGNIIVENLNITNPHSGDAYDGMSVKQELHNILITKCSFFNTGDGACDITNESDFVTVSWCKFYYPSPPNPGHTFACLVGSSDKQTDDEDDLHVSYHHNWWTTGVKERMPRVRYGQVHVYNNYYSDLLAGGYCVGRGCGSRIRVENNYFNAAPEPWKRYDQDANYPIGHMGWNTGNILYNCGVPDPCITNEYSTIFTPPYPYTLDDAADVPDEVQAYAGAGTPYPPHWFYTVYGDFDKDGKVGMDDVATFVDYWLNTNCSAISDADYDNNCNVNFYEFSLMAESWMQ